MNLRTRVNKKKDSIQRKAGWKGDQGKGPGKKEQRPKPNGKELGARSQRPEARGLKP